MNQRISLAFSPDTDDAFMVHALRAREIDPGPYEFTFTAADIQRLNEEATRGVHDVTAISIAAYPSLADEYLLMPVGASIGDEFGPAVIVRSDSALKSAADLRGKRIAVPGRQTSAFFAARGLIGDFVAMPMGFLAIGPAVARGEVDAGVLIHELQLNPEASGFRKLGDLGRWWFDRYRLPLPLGANAVRRSLGTDVIRDVTRLLRQSIEAGLANRAATLTAAMASSKADLDRAGGEQYISMYVNHRSLSLQDDVRGAISQLLAVGEAAGLCPGFNLAEALYE